MDRDKFLDACVQHCFDQTEINLKPLRDTHNIELPPRCVLIELKGRRVKILRKDDIIQEKRLEIFLKFLQEFLSECALQFNFRFILNTYDEDIKTEFSIFEFSRECTSRNNLIVPDPHLTSFYMGKRTSDGKHFEDKIPKIVFRGTDTGVYPDSESNERIYFCDKFKDDSLYDFKISKFLDYTPEHLERHNFDIKNIEGEYLSHEEQAEYRYIADINGHTIAWDRNCWALSLNSVLIKFQKEKVHKFETWYSNYLYRRGIVPVCSNHQDVRELEGREKEIIRRQKEFSKLLLSRRVNMEYLKRLLCLYQEKYHT